eukprot:TRINITY_DN19213_c0_g1_i1.p1 TRINITY_DN19213_c0_g1~~TRINITY_DN19213_c0_g1_i1.p1  ORF type:complete len:1164 (-),score=222.83 TRINITY_DN19213_c0_g1_i1:193-3684(-)
MTATSVGVSGEQPLHGPFVPGSLRLQVDAEALVKAVTWLTSAVQEERHARRELEDRVAEASSAAERACTLATEVAVPANIEPTGAGGAAVAAPPPGVDALHQELQRLQQFARHLQRAQDNLKKEQEQRQKTKEELLGLRLEELRHDVTAKAPAHALDALQDALTEKVSELVTTETRAAVQMRLAHEAEHLRERLDRVAVALSTRLDGFDEQLRTFQSLEGSDRSLQCSEGVNVAETHSSSHGAAQGKGISARKSSSPVADPISIAKHPVLGNASIVSSTRGGETTPCTKEGVNATSKTTISPPFEAGVVVQADSPLVDPSALPSEALSAASMPNKSSVDAVVQADAITANVSRIADEAAEIRRSSASASSVAGSDLADTCSPALLRKELIAWVEGRLEEVKDSIPSNSDSVVQATSQLREELKGWLASQRVDLDVPRSGESVTKLAVSTDTGELGPSIAEEVSAAVNRLREEVADWLQNKVGEMLPDPADSAECGAPLQQPAQVSDNGLGGKSVSPCQSRYASKGSGVVAKNVDPYTKAVVTLRRDVSKWLEGHVETLREQLLGAKDEAQAKSAETRESSAPQEAPTSTRPHGSRHRGSVARTSIEAPLSDISYPSVETPSNEMISDPVAAAKWFQSQLQELHTTLTENREQAIDAAVKKLRDEIQPWISEELARQGRFAPQRPTSPHDEPAAFELDTFDETPEKTEGDDSAPSPTHNAPRRNSFGRSGDLMGEVRSSLLADDVFLAGLSDHFAIGAVNSAPSGREQRLTITSGMSKSEDPKGRTNSLDDGIDRILGGAAALKVQDLGSVEERLSELEEAVAAQGRRPGGIQYTSLLEVCDELRRLKCRYEFIEKMLPEDAQRTLQFFEPLQNDQPEGSDHSELMSQKSRENTKNAASISEEAKGLAEDSKREVMNVSLALRGVQRDAEVSGARIEDLRRGLAAQQSRLEAVLAQVLQAVEEITQHAGLASLSESRAIQDLRVLVTEGDVSDTVPHPFVSQAALHQTIQSLQTEVQTLMQDLRKDLVDSVQGKADGAAVKCLSEQLAKQERQRWVKTTLDEVSDPKSASTDTAAGMRWPARCVSCDARVEPKVERDVWPPQPGVPGPPFPQRVAHGGKDLRPLGAGMVRNVSLPTLKPVAEAAAGGSRSSHHQSQQHHQHRHR